MSSKNSPPFTSASRRRVLGRGLDNFFFPSSKEELETKGVQKTSSICVLGIEQIQPNPHQPRRVFDKEFLKELADSIRKNGLIQPVIVKKRGSKYEIIAGERRWRASAQAGLHEIPVRILEGQEDNPFLSLVENLQRENLNPIELAQAYKKLMEEHNFTQEKLAEQLGLPRATLANQLRILKLPLEIRNLILKGQLSLALAKILLQLKESSSQVKWASYFVKHKTGVREAQKLLSQKKPNKRRKKAQESLPPWQTQAIRKIQDLHGVTPSLQFKKKGGDLCLRFFSDEQLRYIIDTLLRRS
ncbi:MAG: ParB/RepB/Spo0J family partition protein [Bdellovibrionales bacterium]|nr:ParB/RepB/Spo0J family partition protein [Bdellovibrionales bacterium]